MKSFLTIVSLFLVVGFVGVAVVEACQASEMDPDVCINLEGVQASVPEGYFGVEGVCTPEVTPTVSPEVTETPTVTPEPTTPPAGHGDGLSDGKSDGKSSCPSCTAAPVIPLGAPATGKGL